MDKIILILFIILLIIIFCNKESFGNNNYLSLLNNIYTNNLTNFICYNKGKKMNGVDCIYAIVMPDRIEYMRNVLNKIGYEYVLFNAITPSKLNNKIYTSLSANQYYINKKTRLPVQLSFTMCYLDAINKNYKTIIVFEDDLVINKDINQIIKGINEFNKSDYNIFYMGYCELNCNQQFKVDNNLELVNVRDYSKLWCCHSICYKVKYLPDIIKYLYPMNNEFDIKLTQIYKNLNYKICIPKSVYFDQNKNLGTNNETNNADGSLLLSPPTCNI